MALTSSRFPSSELYQEIARDSELLSFFDVGDFVSVSVAISAGLGGEVSFPDREDDVLGPVSDDSATMLDIAVFDQGEWLTYPFPAYVLLERLVALYLASGPVQAWSAFERRVRAVEGIEARISRKPFAPSERWDELLGPKYEYVRTAPDTMTVAAWKRRRAPMPPYFECEVLRPDRSIASGRTQLKVLRASWGADSPSPEPTVDERVFDIFRRARFFAAVERARSME